MRKTKENENITSQSASHLLGAIVMVITFLSLLHTFNVFLETKSFQEYRYSIRSIENCTPLGGNHPPDSCRKTDNDLLRDYRKIHYLPILIAFTAPAAYFLYKLTRKVQT